MKKFIMFLLLGAVLNTAATAQSNDKKEDEKKLKNTIKDKKEDKHEAGKDLAHLRIKSAVKGRSEVRHHRKSIHHQGRHLRTHGENHPIENAKHKAKVDKDVKKD